MGKNKRFTQGDFVSGKKWNGEHFIGIYEHEYDCGDHSVFDGEKYFCIHRKDCHHANEEEIKEIKKRLSKNLKNKKVTEENLSEDEIEQLLTEKI